MSEDAVIEGAKRGLAAWQSAQADLQIHFERLDFQKDIYFQAFYLFVRSSSTLASLRESCMHELNLPARPYMPHMSLFYSSSHSEAYRTRYIEELHERHLVETSPACCIAHGVSQLKVRPLGPSV
jgi:hypothetical protein